MSHHPNASNRLSILIAGGRELVTALDETGLPGRGAQVFVAGDGAGAICELLTNTYDVALIDDTLPRIDGMRLVALIRSTSQVARLPIIVIVAEADERARLEAIRLGANDAFRKPVDAGRLEASLARFVPSNG